jgi:hypothetical protein
MHYLSITGLILDMLGVLILSIDVIRIQRRLRSDAADRLASLQEVAEANADTDVWLKDLVINADWSEHDWMEGRGRAVPGTFDSGAAKASFEDALGYVAGVSADMHKVAKLLLTTAEADEKTASLSLRVSYAGLALIIVGFAFQALGQLAVM